MIFLIKLLYYIRFVKNIVNKSFNYCLVKLFPRFTNDRENKRIKNLLEHQNNVKPVWLEIESRSNERDNEKFWIMRMNVLIVRMNSLLIIFNLFPNPTVSFWENFVLRWTSSSIKFVLCAMNVSLRLHSSWDVSSLLQW